MGKVIVWGLVLYAVVDSVLSCFQCFVDADETSRLCKGYILSGYDIVNLDHCFNAIYRIFNNTKVIQAAHVAGGYEDELRNIMLAQIMPLIKEFETTNHYDFVYEDRLQKAADSFITEASRLPRAFQCVPPCGFQESAATYDCVTCLYKICGFSLDCPGLNITGVEHNGTEILCDVPFPLPADIEVVWRFADEVKTELVDHFKELTIGVDLLYTIPSLRLDHEGTYQCEIFSNHHSVIRNYYHLTVIPQPPTGCVELHHVFGNVLLLEEEHWPVTQPHDGLVSPARLPFAPVLTACLAVMHLLAFLCLWYLYWLLAMRRTTNSSNQEPDGPPIEIFLVK
ncbi:sperm acrosome associated 6 isoform X1 [Brienomyrus brachyistius]|uniref:sperm acrosome associated 6 isoform X1 n=1 Tax=Brienomyrus brachyistius TaxID=42636 RepID=UPI0020B27D95|nr:sperm acrosome associated 6 isoform X1 [Brienomyrus brachyistius]